MYPHVGGCALGKTIHESDFCAQIAAAVELLSHDKPESYFTSGKIEGYGTGALKLRRKDLRFYSPTGKLVLTGEVKLPGTPKGRSPYADDLVQDAHQKADNENVQYFFTWNVNTFVLWDREKWDVPLLERRVREWRLGLDLASPEDIARPEVLERIKNKFLPALLSDLAAIVTGRQPDWGMPPDHIFIRSLESHLDWPVGLLRSWLHGEADRDRSFDMKLQEWLASQDRTFVRSAPDEWRGTLDAAARSLCYVLTNRIIFYQALRARFEELPALRLVGAHRRPERALQYLLRRFEHAVRVSGDYEPLFHPRAGEHDWGSMLLFKPAEAVAAWSSVLRAVEGYDFSSVSSDIVGRIFQRLISPEERHRYGQHFTSDEVVDLINAFCIRDADANVLDPACGSGSFLVRAYYLKKVLNPARTHAQRLSELFGCDIALYPAHLATLNLAAREITDERNYPCIARKDFFDVRHGEPFCTVPGPDPRTVEDVFLPALDAVVGNPPYVRQEKLGKELKDKLGRLLRETWPDVGLSGRSDLHCYFWPAAARFLRVGGYFGFLSSSSWLDVEYGFPLQEWMLRNFRIVAILESTEEPWFEDARVKTCATILQRCSDQTARDGNVVRFVRFQRCLVDILGKLESEDDAARFQAAAGLRDRILGVGGDFADGDLRIIVKPQAELWDEGQRAGKTLGVSFAGKWGRFLRAPQFYFDLIRARAQRMFPFGEIAQLKCGIRSGCDGFFMPLDVTEEKLKQFPEDRAFSRQYGIPRLRVAECKVKIVRAGDGSVHPIESEYLAPEVHSLMQIKRPEVRGREIKRMVLLVDKPLSALAGTLVRRYLQYGEKHSFASAKSRPVPIPKRTTCAARHPWYDLTGIARPGLGFWPEAQQYRHIVAANPDRLICNHNLFDISAPKLSKLERRVLVAVLNSTILGLFKTFYGRYAGTEGNLKTEVVDVNLIEVPDPRGVDERVAGKILAAFERMCERPAGRLLEEELMECHSPERAREIAKRPIVLPVELRQPDRRALDDAVFEMLCVKDPAERARLIDQLYEETARHYRQIRVVEIEKMEQRSKTKARRFRPDELAADAWDAAQLEDTQPLREWLMDQPGTTKEVRLPEGGNVQLPPAEHMFDAKIVYFGKGREAHVECATRAEAELVARLGSLGSSGPVSLPPTGAGCSALLAALDARVAQARAGLGEVARSRTGENDKLLKEVTDLLMHWYVHGRPMRRPASD
ncbi:MAG: hypothetical protein FJ290_01825 [Planctomycetes bacterium]|nr:hypothetical protein [Planctomycetota bacterium]